MTPSVLLSDCIWYVADLHEMAIMDAENPQNSDKARSDSRIMAKVWANAYAEIDGHLHPKKVLVPGVCIEDPKPLITVTLETLQQIIDTAKANHLPADALIHLRDANGLFAAFTINPQIDNGGIQLHESLSIL
jgi:hypothetical protein